MDDQFHPIWDELGVGRRRRPLLMGPNQWRPGQDPPVWVSPQGTFPIVRSETKTVLKHSRFEVTVSSNQRVSEDRVERNADIEVALQRSTDWLFRDSWKVPGGKGDNFLDIYNVWKGARGNTVKTDEKPDRDQIISVAWKPGKLEYGMKKKGRRIHYHGVLSVYHYSQIRINQKRAQGYLNYMTTTMRNKYIWPSPPLRFPSRYIRGVYVHAISLDNETAAIYNEKTLIHPYIQHLKSLAPPS